MMAVEVTEATSSTVAAVTGSAGNQVCARRTPLTRANSIIASSAAFARREQRGTLQTALAAYLPIPIRRRSHNSAHCTAIDTAIGALRLVVPDRAGCADGFGPVRSGPCAQWVLTVSAAALRRSVAARSARSILARRSRRRSVKTARRCRPPAFRSRDHRIRIRC